MENNKNNKSSGRSAKKSDKSISTNCENKVKRNRNKDKKDQKSKRDKYNTHSHQTVLKDLKSSATRSLTNVRNTFDNLSNKLKFSSIQNQDVAHKSDENNYNKLTIGTPVQLYSPFGIETPSPRVDRKHLKRSCCRQMFFSPTAKFREDVKYLTNGINELNMISEGIENRNKIEGQIEGQFETQEINLML